MSCGRMSQARNSSNSSAMIRPRARSSRWVLSAWRAITSASQAAMTFGMRSSATTGAASSADSAA